jgi:hypothetical protein
MPRAQSNVQNPMLQRYETVHNLDHEPNLLIAYFVAYFSLAKSDVSLTDTKLTSLFHRLYEYVILHAWVILREKCIGYVSWLSARSKA